MFFILALMTLVASMNIISLMFMEITQKRADIAILRSMGASHALIRRIFLCMGLIITLSATIAGELAGALICHLLQKIPVHPVTRCLLHHTSTCNFRMANICLSVRRCYDRKPAFHLVRDSTNEIY